MTPPPSRNGARRALPPYARDALEVLGDAESERLPEQLFRSMMDAKGWSGHDTAYSIAALERRGWVRREGPALLLTAEGRAAAQSAPQPKKLDRTGTANRVAKTRMPRGLF